MNKSMAAFGLALVLPAAAFAGAYEGSKGSEQGLGKAYSDLRGAAKEVGERIAERGENNPWPTPPVPSPMPNPIVRSSLQPVIEACAKKPGVAVVDALSLLTAYGHCIPARQAPLHIRYLWVTGTKDISIQTTSQAREEAVRKLEGMIVLDNDDGAGAKLYILVRAHREDDRDRRGRD